MTPEPCARTRWIGRWPRYTIVPKSWLDPARAWTETRDLPPIATKTFTDQWRAKKRAASSKEPVQ